MNRSWHRGLTPSSPGASADGTDPVYLERRVALRWPLVGVGVVAPGVLAVAFVVGVVTGVGALWGVAAPALVLVLVIWGALAFRNWPTGIRITGGELWIGAIGSRRAAGRGPTVTHQSRALFCCPLAGVRSMDVVTDPARIRQIKRSPDLFTLTNRWGKPRGAGVCKLGVLTSPFMRAALVVELDGGWARFPATRSAWFFPNAAGRPLRTRLTGEESLTWVVPTRRPERLRAAIGA
ncbi:hypothetical protein [Streptomyces sp. CA-111067]|uniref:hypothetical protein n=1 Tax=Streptomyces sp. CA-111067 TaxID=3240046 RepID=UPI003D97B96E